MQEDRIIGGEVTGIDEFPWLALLEYEKRNSVDLKKSKSIYS